MGDVHSPTKNEDIDGYKMTAKIGSGGIAEVWHARAVGGGDVAFKVLLREHQGAELYEQQFAAEIHVARRLPDDPHLQRYVGHGRVKGLSYVAYEYVPGVDLGEVLSATLAARRADVSEQLKRVIVGLAHKDPNRRFPSAAMADEALRRAPEFARASRERVKKFLVGVLPKLDEATRIRMRDSEIMFETKGSAPPPPPIETRVVVTPAQEQRV